MDKTNKIITIPALVQSTDIPETNGSFLAIHNRSTDPLTHRTSRNPAHFTSCAPERCRQEAEQRKKEDQTYQGKMHHRKVMTLFGENWSPSHVTDFTGGMLETYSSPSLITRAPHIYTFLFLFFWLCLMACRILFLWSRMETVSTAVKAQSPNHWCSVAQSCLTPGGWPPWTVARQAPLPVGILQARILEWVAISSSRGSSQPRNRTQVSHITGRFFIIWATWEAS